MAKYFKKYMVCLILAIVFGWGEVFFTTQSVYLMGTMLDMAIADTLKDALLKISAQGIAYVLLCMVCIFISNYFLQTFSTSITYSLQKMILTKLYQQQTYEYEQKNSDEYFTVMDYDMEQIRATYLNNILLFFISIGQIVIYWVALLNIHPVIFVSSILLGILPLVASRVFVRPLQSTQENLSTKQNIFVQAVQELLQGYSVIKSSNNQGRFIDRFNTKNQEKLHLIRRRGLLQTMAFQTLWGVNIFSACALLMIASMLVSRGAIQIGQLIVSVNLVSISSNVYSDILRSFLQILSMKSIREKINAFIVDEQGNENTLKHTVKAPIVLDKLSHRFGNRSIIQDFSFCFEDGKCYAIIGDSGSGKSTLARLLTREVQTQEGVISFASTPITEFSEAEIYDGVGYVRQNNFVFHDTLYNNITMFTSNQRTDSEDQDYQSAIRKANLSALDERCRGEKLLTAKLSGGEKRRIEIARTLYQKKKIIIFDEATSGLDPENQNLINELIFSLKGITRIVVTHNWEEEYLKKFDEVIVLGDRGMGHQASVPEPAL